jgi:hypothetical protein
MYSFPPSSCTNTAPITVSCAAIYNLNGTPDLGARKTGGLDKYLFILLKASYCSAPQVNSASFFSQSKGTNDSIFPARLDMNRLK